LFAGGCTFADLDRLDLCQVVLVSAVGAVDVRAQRDILFVSSEVRLAAQGRAGAKDQLPEIALPQRPNCRAIAGLEQLNPMRDRVLGRHGRSSRKGGENRDSFYAFAWQCGIAKSHELNRGFFVEAPVQSTISHAEAHSPCLPSESAYGVFIAAP
jgi:hypothetical protein